MDDIVRQAMAKWPNVPHCYGWLGLDARGNWYMRDDRTQAAGAFPSAKGSLLRHEKLIDFIQRNYAPDHDGQWYFQNGPQRVYVELEITPLVWRLGPGDRFTTHAGVEARPRACLVDEQGRVYLDSEVGFGLVHTQDIGLAAEAIERGVLHPDEVLSAGLPARFGYIVSPAARRATTAPSTVP
jgi:hypothetical protein